jgi:hypothetical protein
MLNLRYTIICQISIVAMLFLCPKGFSQEAPNERIPKNTKLIYVVDSVQIANDQISKIVPVDIASVVIVKGKRATDLLGPKAKDGIVYIETKKFARIRYWKYFKSKSSDYAKVLPNPEKDNLIQYVLDGRILKKDYEGELSSINDSNFQKIEIVPKDSLLKRYGIYRKQYGVVIRTK